jgi:hypothetical protein
VVTRIFAVAQKNLKRRSGGNREGAATYYPMLVTPVRFADVKLVQPKNAPLGCIITCGSADDKRCTRGTLELAFMITTKLK